MKNTVLTLCTLLISIGICNSQSFYQKAICDQISGLSGTCLTSVNDGTMCIAGTANIPGGGFMEMIVLKTDTFGNVLWSKVIGDGGLPGVHFVSSLCELQDTSLVVAGYSSTIGNGGPMLVILSPDGNYLRSWSFDSATVSVFNQVIPTNTNELAIVGKKNNKMSLLKVNPTSGTILMEKYFGTSSSQGSASAQSLIQLNDSGFVVSGIVCEDIWAGTPDVLILRTNYNGDIQWCRKIGGTESEGNSKVILTSDSCLLVCGSTDSWTSGIQPLLMKLDLDGNLIWSKVYNMNDPLNSYGMDVVDLQNSRFAIACSSLTVSGNAADVLITDTAGLVISSPRYGYEDYFSDFMQVTSTSDNSLYLTGAIDLHDSLGLGPVSGIFMVKADENGLGSCTEASVSPVALTVSMLVESYTSSVTTNSSRISVSPLIYDYMPGLLDLCNLNSLQLSDKRSDILVYYDDKEKGMLIFSDNDEIIDIEIVHLSGQIISREAAGTNTLWLSLADYTPGMYILKVRTVSCKEYRKKIVIPN